MRASSCCARNFAGNGDFLGFAGAAALAAAALAGAAFLAGTFLAVVLAAAFFGGVAFVTEVFFTVFFGAAADRLAVLVDLAVFLLPAATFLAVVERAAI